jgi:sporulation protein YlmC with PRC-barrel domain
MNAKGITLACLLSCVGAVEAQQAPVAGRVVLGISATETEAVAVGYRASKLIGALVYNEQNEKIGKVGDLIVKPDGTLSLAIINVGGFLGVGTHHVAIPVQQFKSVQPKLVLPGATKDALKELPAFEYAK